MAFALQAWIERGLLDVLLGYWFTYAFNALEEMATLRRWALLPWPLCRCAGSESEASRSQTKIATTLFRLQGNLWYPVTKIFNEK